MGSSRENVYGEYKFESLERKPYWPSDKLPVFIIGASGFVASHIPRRLKSECHYILLRSVCQRTFFCHEFHLVDLKIMDNRLKVTTGVEHMLILLQT